MLIGSREVVERFKITRRQLEVLLERDRGLEPRQVGGRRVFTPQEVEAVGRALTKRATARRRRASA